MGERPVPLFFAFAGGKALAILFGVLAAVLVGRLIGPQGLGRWTLILAAGTLLHTALVNWTHASTVRFGREEWVRTRSLSRTLYGRLPLLASSIGLTLLLLVVQPADWLRRFFAISPSDWWMVSLCALSVWLAAEAQATMQATDRMMLQAILAPLVAALALLALLTLFWLGQRSLESTTVTLTVLPIAGWGGAWLHSLFRSNTRPTGLVLDDVWQLLRYAWPMLPGFALGYVSAWAGPLLLGRFSSVTEVGLFGMSYQFMIAAMSANGVLSTFLLPWLIRRETEAQGAMRDYVECVAPTLYALWMIGTMWLVAALPVGVMLLTGRGFDASIDSLLILLVAVPSNAVMSLFTVLFDVQRRLGRIVVYLLAATLANLAVCLVLIPVHGAAGAAIGTALSFIVGQVLYIWDQHRHLAAPAGRMWALWVVGLALGFGQLAVGAGTGMRTAWAILATAALLCVARIAGCIDGLLVSRLFAGRFTPIAALINLLLVVGT